MSSFFPPVVESHGHPVTAPSLRIAKPFSALVNYAMLIDLDNMDVADHGHVPFIVILGRVLEEWKKAVSLSYLYFYRGSTLFLKSTMDLLHPHILKNKKKKSDEENFDEAGAQPYRCWTQTSSIPFELTVFIDQSIVKLQSFNSPRAILPSSCYFALVHQKSTNLCTPTSSILPDMKSTIVLCRLGSAWKPSVKLSFSRPRPSKTEA